MSVWNISVDNTDDRQNLTLLERECERETGRVSPVSNYSKYLVTSLCEYENKNGNNDSDYCPGYSDAMETQHFGTRNARLHEMADIFCSHCSVNDTICSSLFCEPEKHIIVITQSLIESFCTAIQIYYPSCYTEYCPTSVKKRDVSSVTNQVFTCKATIDWSVVAGMNQWCESNCHNGNDDTNCPERYCECTVINEYTSTVSSDNLESVCLVWEASVVWSAVAGMDSWCQSVCTSNGDCDPSYCQCRVMSSASTTTVTTSTTQSTTNPMVTSTFHDNITTSDNQVVNITDTDSLNVVEGILCDHATIQHHNLLSDQYCPQKESQDIFGYQPEILDQVLTFAPQLMCAMTDGSQQSNTCPNMFCGETPLSQEIIKSAICTMCRLFSDGQTSTCETVYCQ
ncbi:hypothetical protein ACF0H5_019085 [Mactra antiquata]